VSVGSSSPPPETAVFEAGVPGSAGEPNAAAAAPDACPLCGAPLDPEQEWCLRCGAAARTRLAMSSNWKAPVIAVATIAALSLGVLAAALVVLIGNFGGSTSTVTTTASSVTVGAGATTPTAAATTPTAATGAATTPAATTPAAATTAGYPGTASGPLSTKPTVTPPPGPAPKTIQISDLITGSGAIAKNGDVLTVNYVGILFHGGAEFDSSWKRHSRFTFTLGTSQVIEGWNEGVVGMKVGGRRELSMPASLAYGARGLATVPPIPPNEPLVFVVDLLAVTPAATAHGAVGTSTTPAMKK
jgi:FKBP-type peptidyl-prolyl cis-trans isomerase